MPSACWSLILLTSTGRLFSAASNVARSCSKLRRRSSARFNFSVILSGVNGVVKSFWFPLALGERKCAGGWIFPICRGDSASFTSNARPPDDSANVADASEIVIVVAVRLGANWRSKSIYYSSIFRQLTFHFDKK
jgi:hypothetical protein